MKKSEMRELIIQKSFARRSDKRTPSYSKKQSQKGNNPWAWLLPIGKINNLVNQVIREK